MLKKRDWKEKWVDQMGLIVALAGEQRFKRLESFKLAMSVALTEDQCEELRECLRQRFTPSSLGSKLPKEP